MADEEQEYHVFDDKRKQAAEDRALLSQLLEATVGQVETLKRYAVRLAERDAKNGYADMWRQALGELR